MKMIARMRERLEAKLANANNNAFKMRKLFKMYDKEQSGLVRTQHHSKNTTDIQDPCALL